MTSTTTGIDWQLRLNSTPRQVFGALVTTASAHGRLIRVENFGTALVFAPAASAHIQCAPLRATVSNNQQGTLLRFSATRQSERPRDVAAQAESVGSLIRQLRERRTPVDAPSPTPRPPHGSADRMLVAVAEGFEPSVGLHPQTLSRRSP